MAAIVDSPTAATGRSTLTCTPATSRTTAKCEAATSPTHTRALYANTWRCTANRRLHRVRATSPPPRLSCLHRPIWAETLCLGRKQPIWANGTCVTAQAPAAHTVLRADLLPQILQRVHLIRTPEKNSNRVLVATFVIMPWPMWESEKAVFSGLSSLAPWQIHVTAKPQKWGDQLVSHVDRIWTIITTSVQFIVTVYWPQQKAPLLCSHLECLYLNAVEVD